MKIARNRTRILDFLAPIYEGRRVATYFDEHVTKPLEHIAGHWELSWDIEWVVFTKYHSVDCFAN